MTNEMLQTNDTNTSATLATRLLVAMEMSLKKWRLVMSPEGGTRNRVKTVEAGNYLELEKAVAEARERFKLPPHANSVDFVEGARSLNGCNTRGKACGIQVRTQVLHG